MIKSLIVIIVYRIDSILSQFDTFEWAKKNIITKIYIIYASLVQMVHFKWKTLKNSAEFNLDQGSIENCGRIGLKIMLFLTVHEMVIPYEL